MTENADSGATETRNNPIEPTVKLVNHGGPHHDTICSAQMKQQSSLEDFL